MLFEEQENFFVDEEKGIITIIIRSLVKNKIREVFVPLQLSEVLDDKKVQLSLITDIKELKIEVHSLQEKVGEQ